LSSFGEATQNALKVKAKVFRELYFQASDVKTSKSIVNTQEKNRCGLMNDIKIEPILKTNFKCYRFVQQLKLAILL